MACASSSGLARSPSAARPARRRLSAGRSTQRRARLGRQEQVGDRAAALGRRRAEAGAVPRLHLAARHAHAVEQQLEVVLRVGHRIAAAERRIAGLGGCRRCPARPTPRRPAPDRDRAGSPRRRGSSRDHAQQPRQRGRGAGHARGDDRHARRRARASAARRDRTGGCAARAHRSRRARASSASQRALDASRTARVLACQCPARSPKMPSTASVEQRPRRRCPRPAAGPSLRAISRARRSKRGAADGCRRRPAPRAAARPAAASAGSGRRRAGSSAPAPSGSSSGAQRLVEIEIADHRHARQQQPAPD